MTYAVEHLFVVKCCIFCGSFFSYRSRWFACSVHFFIYYRGADMSLARTGRKQATATKLTFASHSKKNFRELSVQPGLRGSNDNRVGRKMATFKYFFFSRVAPKTYQQHPCTHYFPKSPILIISKIISVRKWYRERHVSLLWSPRPRLLYRAEILHPPRLLEPVACSYNIAYPLRRPVTVWLETLATITNNTVLIYYRIFKRWIRWYI
jgi:hypothetical protein